MINITCSLTGSVLKNMLKEANRKAMTTKGDAFNNLVGERG